MKLSEFISKYGDCEVTEEMEKFIEKPKVKWKPSKGTWYYYVNNGGMVMSEKWYGSGSDMYRFDFFRIFKTKEEADRYLEIMMACKEASFEPDWENEKQPKYFMKYCYGNKILTSTYVWICEYGQRFYFKSEEIIKKLIERFGEKDIAKYVLGVEVEEND